MDSSDDSAGSSSEREVVPSSRFASGLPTADIGSVRAETTLSEPAFGSRLLTLLESIDDVRRRLGGPADLPEAIANQAERLSAAILEIYSAAEDADHLAMATVHAARAMCPEATDAVLFDETFALLAPSPEEVPPDRQTAWRLRVEQLMPGAVEEAPIVLEWHRGAASANVIGVESGVTHGMHHWGKVVVFGTAERRRALYLEGMTRPPRTIDRLLFHVALHATAALRHFGRLRMVADIASGVQRRPNGEDPDAGPREVREDSRRCK